MAGILDVNDLPRILVYAEFNIVAIFDQAPQVADAYRIQLFVVVAVEEAVVMMVEEVVVEEVVVVVENADEVAVVVEEVVSHGGGGTSHHHHRYESRCRQQHSDAPHHKGGLLYSKGGTRQPRLMLRNTLIVE